MKIFARWRAGAPLLGAHGAPGSNGAAVRNAAPLDEVAARLPLTLASRN